MQWRSRRLLLIILGSGAILLFGFTYGRRVQISISLKSSEAISAQRLEQTVNSPMGRFASIFMGAFYAGSDDRFDYVVMPLGRFTVQAFKIRRGELGIQHRKKLTSDERDWMDITEMFPGSR